MAPWQVHLCAVRADADGVKAFADGLYEQLQEMGVEVIYDDRPVRAGVMFSDADLLGVPFRVVVSPRNLENGTVEIVSRDKSLSLDVPKDEALEKIMALLSQGE